MVIVAGITTLFFRSVFKIQYYKKTACHTFNAKNNSNCPFLTFFLIFDDVIFSQTNIKYVFVLIETYISIFVIFENSISKNLFANVSFKSNNSNMFAILKTNIKSRI